MSSIIAPILLFLLYTSSWLVHAKSGNGKITNGLQLSRRAQKQQWQRVLQSPSLCSCSPTIFNIQINFHADPCKTDKLEDNSGIKGTLCLVGNDGNIGTEGSTGNETDDSLLVVESSAPSSAAAGSGTSSPVVSPTVDSSKVPSFSPTFNPTSAGSTAGSAAGSTAGSTMNTQDPFLPPAGAMPVPPPSEAIPTYAPSTPFPTYGTYSPTSSTYAPTAVDAGTRKNGPFIEPVKATFPSVETTYYPTVDGTYAPTEKKTYGVASLVKRVKMINTPSTSNTYAPSTPFPTFDTYSPNSGAAGKSEPEPMRRLLEVINLDEMDAESTGESLNVHLHSAAVSNMVDTWRSIPPNDEFFSRFPEWKEHQEEIYRLKHKDYELSASNSENQSRLLQESIAVPTQLISAQFLEIDTSPDMTIINQDDSYLDLTDFNDEGIKLSYTSISSTLDPSVALEDQIDSVPGGAILVLIGQDESGEFVRNRIMWTYTMKCGLSVETVEDGDEFGWALFVSIIHSCVPIECFKN